MSRAPHGYVFGYGSLAADAAAGGRLAELPGFARGWGVAMDNRRDLPGYKYYTDADGRRPGVHVAFPDVAPACEGTSVLGVLWPVDPAQLARLDRRERNYRRVEVGDRIASAAGAPVWVYVGTDAARRRLADGRRALAEGHQEGAAVIHAGYLRGVLAGFAAFGDAAVAACRRELDPGELPVWELVRRELPVYFSAQPGSVVGAAGASR